jgi:putative exporter of polyketide antibiotics
VNELPTWVKFIAQVGFPIAVALWLMVFITPKIVASAEAVQAHVHDAQIQTALLRAICRNTAKTELAGQFCEYGQPSWGQGR